MKPEDCRMEDVKIRLTKENLEYIKSTKTGITYYINKLIEEARKKLDQ